MSQEKTLRQRIRAGEVLVALRGSLTTGKSELADIWATGRYDYIWIDGQHTAFTEQQLVDYCAAAEELGIDVQLRIPHTRAAHLVAFAVLPSGCQGNLCRHQSITVQIDGERLDARREIVNSGIQ